MSKQPNAKIAPATGKLGILVPGMDAVTTTFIAGLEAVKRGLGQPVGSEIVQDERRNKTLSSPTDSTAGPLSDAL